MSKLETEHLALQAEEFFSPALGFAIFQISSTVARLGIPDMLGDSIKTGEELATATGAHPDSVYRLLRAATATGMLARTADGKFTLTTLGSMFRSDSPSRASSVVALNAAAPVWQAWGALEDAVRTGKAAFNSVHGVGMFDYLQRDPRLAEVFHAAMASGTESQIPLLVPHYDFTKSKHVVDVGGGNGTHLAAVLVANQHLHGTVFDTESALRDAPDVLRAASVANRCVPVVGDFFESIPSGGDVYLLKNVLTDWDDKSCERILHNCRTAMDSGAKVLVIASLMSEEVGSRDPTEDLITSIFDISLMTLTTGRERTLAEYASLFVRAGLRLGEVARIPRTSIHHTMLYHTIEALPAPGASTGFGVC